MMLHDKAEHILLYIISNLKQIYIYFEILTCQDLFEDFI